MEAHRPPLRGAAGGFEVADLGEDMQTVYVSKIPGGYQQA